MFKWNYPAKTGMDKEIQIIRFKERLLYLRTEMKEYSTWTALEV